MKNNIFALSLCLASFGLMNDAIAQKKQKLYYASGALAFEGAFHTAWNQEESFQQPELMYDVENLSVFSSADLSTNLIFIYKDITPTRVYEGLCKYYYSSGKLLAEGNYKSGFKNGAFKFYHPNGKLGANQSYEWGMAVGHWESWDLEGRLTSSFHYKAVPEAMLNTINASRFKSNDSVSNATKLLYGNAYEEYFQEYNNPALAFHSRNLKTISDIVVRHLYHKAIKEGDFKMWRDGKPFLTMQFKNNIPTGIWTLYDKGDKIFEVVFENGAITKATDFVKPENNYGSPEYLAKKQKQTDDYLALSNTKKTDEVFRAVQKKPEPGYNVNTYFAKNIKLPKNAKDLIENRIIVEFVVRKDGSITDTKIVRGKTSDEAFNESIIKAVESMPKWNPAMQSGQAVSAYFTMPVNINLD